MKRTILLFLCTFNHNASASNPSQSATPPNGSANVINFSPNFYTSPTANATNDNTSYQAQQQSQIQKNDINITSTITHTFRFEWPEIKFPTKSEMYDYTATSASYIQTQIWDNKWTIFAATLATVYSWMLYNIKQTEKMIAEHDSWCNWKSVVSITHLALSKGQDLQQQLNFDLHKKYALNSSDISKNNFTMMFINDIKQELHQLNQYLDIHKLATRIWCKSLFWFAHDPNFIEDKKARLLFILDLFMASYTQE